MGRSAGGRHRRCSSCQAVSVAAWDAGAVNSPFWGWS
ncbi:hypothetical protein [Streptomyces sp. ISL-100]